MQDQLNTFLQTMSSRTDFDLLDDLHEIAALLDDEITELCCIEMDDDKLDHLTACEARLNAWESSLYKTLMLIDYLVRAEGSNKTQPLGHPNEEWSELFDTIQALRTVAWRKFWNLEELQFELMADR